MAKEETRLCFYKIFAKRTFTERGPLKLVVRNKKPDLSKQKVYEDYRRNFIKSRQEK